MIKSTSEIIENIQKRINTETNIANKLDMIILKVKLMSCLNISK